MAPKNTSHTKKSSRKARTKEPSPSPPPSPSSSSSDEAEAEISSSNPLADDSMPDGTAAATQQATSKAAATNTTKDDPTSAFSDFYLRHVTTSLASDLEKLRSAKDFHGQRSVDVLVAALRQGEATFGVEQRRKIGSMVAKEGQHGQM